MRSMQKTIEISDFDAYKTESFVTAKLKILHAVKNQRFLTPKTWNVRGHVKIWDFYGCGMEFRKHRKFYEFSNASFFAVTNRRFVNIFSNY